MISMLHSILRANFCLSIFCDFSWEGGGTQPTHKKSYKPSQDLRYKHTDKQTSCYFIIRIYMDPSDPTFRQT